MMHESHEVDDGDSDQTSEYYYNQPREEYKGWDKFEQTEVSHGSASEQHTDLIKKASILLKLATILITFVVVLAGGMITKGAVFYMLSQISLDNPKLDFCPNAIDSKTNETFVKYYVDKGPEETVAWAW